MRSDIFQNVTPVAVPKDQTQPITGRHEEQALSQRRCTAESASRKRRQQKLLAQAEVRRSPCLRLNTPNTAHHHHAHPRPRLLSQALAVPGEAVNCSSMTSKDRLLCRRCCLRQRRERPTRRAPVRMPGHTGRLPLLCKAAWPLS